MSLYGLIAAFSGPEELTEAAHSLRTRGYRRLDAFSPYPVDGLAEALALKKTRLAWIVLAGGVVGTAAAYGLALYSVMIDYPINVGGRPLHAWPVFVILGFEGGILGAALAAFFGMLAANGLPEYYHPVFNAESFGYGKGGGFWLLVEADDERFERAATEALLVELGATRVEEVEP